MIQDNAQPSNMTLEYFPPIKESKTRGHSKDMKAPQNMLSLNIRLLQ
jgi:hypothetical protein